MADPTPGRALAAYKDLCIDAVDPAALGRFWATALGLELHLLDDGDARLSGPTPQHTVWVNRVPEPVTVKQRAHLDVRAEVEELERAGATVVDADSYGWVVMRDPEGGELCAFRPRAQGQAPHLYEIVVDSGPDHEAIARWWAGVLGGSCRTGDRGFSWVEEIDGFPGECIVFGTVPEPKTVKNRIHLDVTTADLDALLGAGAQVLRPRDAQIGWHVLADPDGNEFCAFEVASPTPEGSLG